LTHQNIAVYLGVPIDLPLHVDPIVQRLLWADAIESAIKSTVQTSLSGVATESTLIAVLTQLQTAQVTLAAILTAHRAIINCDNLEPVTLSDSKVVAYRALYCFTAGTVCLKAVNDTVATPFVVPAGYVIREINIVRVMATGSTAGTYIGGW